MGFSGLLSTTSAITTDSIRLCPFYVSSSITIDRVAFEVSAFGAGGNIKFAIYNSSNSRPTTVLLDLGVKAISANAVIEYTISQALASGFYFIAYLPSYNPSIYTFDTRLSYSLYPTAMGTTFVPSTTSPGNAYSFARAYASGFLDLSTSTLVSVASLGNIQFRVA
jgi:hypothetical protein